MIRFFQIFYIVEQETRWKKTNSCLKWFGWALCCLLTHRRRRSPQTNFLVCRGGGGGVRIAFGTSNNLYVDITLLVSRGDLSSFHTLLSVKNFLARFDFLYLISNALRADDFSDFFRVLLNSRLLYPLYVHVCINVSIYASVFQASPFIPICYPKFLLSSNFSVTFYPSLL